MKYKFPLPIFSLALLAALAGCGGNSSTSNAGGNPITTSGNNVAPITVNTGPPELATSGGEANTGFISMSVCVHGTNTCQTLNYVAVDTGSTGIRVLGSKLTVSLTPETDGSGNTIAECNQFGDGYTWGPVETADISITGTGETASNVPIQIVDDTGSFTAAPQQDCVFDSVGNDNSVGGLGAYAIIGIGNFRQDCGYYCTQPAAEQSPYFTYFTCPGGVCNPIATSYTQQLQNPVALFTTDNNGSVIELPLATTQGSTVSGSLVFGIGTQSNNALGSATVLSLAGDGTLTTSFTPGGVPAQSYPESFIDSGSNGFYFLDTSTDGIAGCNDNAGFYCPNGQLNLSATNQGFNNNNSVVNFSIGNADSLPSSGAVSLLAGFNDNPNESFDFGLPFFFGRNVFTGLEGVSGGQPTDTGQYVAY